MKYNARIQISEDMDFATIDSLSKDGSSWYELTIDNKEIIEGLKRLLDNHNGTVNQSN